MRRIELEMLIVLRKCPLGMAGRFWGALLERLIYCRDQHYIPWIVPHLLLQPLARNRKEITSKRQPRQQLPTALSLLHQLRYEALFKWLSTVYPERIILNASFEIAPRSPLLTRKIFQSLRHRTKVAYITKKSILTVDDDIFSAAHPRHNRNDPKGHRL